MITKFERVAVEGLGVNPKLWISEGTSRFDTKWKNKQTSWSLLLGRLQEPTRTPETHAEYMKKGKKEQDSIKDIGGFVGGTLTDGRRKKGHVAERYLLTFDLDSAPVDFISQMQLEYMDTAWAIYSTHKHTKEHPRLRLLMPLDRAVDADEYEAIMRKMAEKIGMDYMDPTTFQPERLMYWASCSADSEYVFEPNDGQLLKADEVLAEYPDWTDQSYWPTHEKEVRVGKPGVSKQQDPLKKPGLVGAFCRTYTITAAINEFLPDVYKAEESGRYSYTKGSTSSGLVIYDNDTFCYSHHSTDPAGGRDLNAFDLVRIHLFGEEDEDESLPVNRQPSFKSMQELARTDEKTLITLDTERRESAKMDFDGEESGSWMLKLTRDKQGAVEKTVENLLTIFRNDPNLRGVQFNQLSEFIELTSPTTWKKELREWTDADDSALYIYLATLFNDFKRSDINDALITIARERPFHPVKDYLDNLPEWDGVKRAEKLFIDYLGAEDEKFTREVTKLWLIAAIKRVYHPGCKFDYIPVLSGPGGIGKSTMANKLGCGWFSDNLSFEDMKDKTAAEKIRGTWINEIAELKGMRKIDVESVKSFITRKEDIYRASYGKRTEKHRRGCVFIGTSNADDYLKDISGNRRFWPIHCGERHAKSVFDMTDEEVGQIWAEAKLLYEAWGNKGLMLSKDMEKVAEQKQIDALEKDERIGLVQAYLDRKLPENWADKDLSERRFWLEDDNEGTVVRTEVCVMEIWSECMGMPPTAKKRTDSDEITKMLLQLGWVKSDLAKRISPYGLQRYYKKGVTS